MGLNAIVKSLDDVEESLHTLYKEKDGQFVLDISGVDNHPAVSGLSKTMKKERDARKKYEKDLQALQSKTKDIDLDALKNLDLEEYKQNMVDLEKLKSDEDKRNKKKLKDKADWEKLEKQLQDQNLNDINEVKSSFQKQIDSYKEKLNELTVSKDREINKMMKSLESELKDKEIIAALAEAKGNVPILMPHISDHVKVIKNDNGVFSARVVNNEGTPRITNTGDPMTISDFVNELKEKPEFQGDGIFAVDKQDGGSGSPGNRGSRNNNDKNNPFTKDNWNLTRQVEIYNDNPAEYDRLKTVAGK